MYVEKDKDRFLKSKGLSRLRYVDKFSLVAAIVGLLLSLGGALFTFPDVLPELTRLVKSVFRIALDFVPTAHAADEQQPAGGVPADLRPIINLVIMVCIGVAFIWSLAVTLHSDNANKIKHAGDVVKLLLGFLIGSAKSYMGLG